MVSKENIKTGLGQIGLAGGDIVLVHSSLSSFGTVDGGAECVIDAILEVITDQGTLIVPTFNFNPGVFDPVETASLVGTITETLRKRPDALRSLHPTHSVAAIGPLARSITKGHEKAYPFGLGSPLFKVLEADGKILQLGVTHISNSMVHVAEEIAEVPYLSRQRSVGTKTPQGKVITKWIRKPGCSRGFGIIEDELQNKEAISETLIGNCRARLMSARAVVDAALEELRLNPEALLCSAPDCEACAESRAMTAAIESQRRDDEIAELSEEEEQRMRQIEIELGVEEVTLFDPGEDYHSLN